MSDDIELTSSDPAIAEGAKVLYGHTRCAANFAEQSMRGLFPFPHQE